MKTILFPLLLVCTTFSFSLHAQESHKLGAGVNFHYDQDSAPGYHLLYQWQFNDSFEFETQYISSNELKLTTNEEDFYINFDHITIGANLMKQYDQKLTIKSGVGLSILTSSSNELIAENNSFSPYLSLSASYEVMNNTIINVGQLSQFHGDKLGTNHSLFLSFSYRFGLSTYQPKGPKQTKIAPQPKKTMPQAPTPPSTQKPFVNHDENIVEHQEKPTLKPQTSTRNWVVQLGAFSEHKNALALLNRLSKKHHQVTLNIVEYADYFRVVSTSFETKQRAQDHVNMLQLQFALQGYVTRLSN